MQEIVAPVHHIRFDIEMALDQQLGSQPLPFPGMDKSGSATCTFYLHSICNKGSACPFRHVRGDRTVVCKHWLRGLCKKGDDCEFLHEYDMSKMPECYFYSKFGICSNKECPFLHIDPEKKIKDCPWYDRGFCRHGPNCKNRHVRRVICQCFLNGFCIEGPDCAFKHTIEWQELQKNLFSPVRSFIVVSPKHDLPTPDPMERLRKASIVCHFCGESGHKAIHCHKMPADMKAETQEHNRDSWHSRIMDEDRRPIQDVTCYKCGEKGHYANKCTKGHLAFLSSGLGK